MPYLVDANGNSSKYVSNAILYYCSWSEIILDVVKNYFKDFCNSNSLLKTLSYPKSPMTVHEKRWYFSVFPHD